MQLKNSRVLLAIGIATICAGTARLAAQKDEQVPASNLLSAAKFGPIPNAPECFTIAVERGNPAAGPSVMLAKFAPGCIAPWHWHIPAETAMVVSGSLEVQMKGDTTVVYHGGDYAYLPSHHVHRASCRSSAPCLVFLSSDAAFDVHWVDSAGNEISLDEALKRTRLGAGAASRNERSRETRSSRCDRPAGGIKPTRPGHDTKMSALGVYLSVTLGSTLNKGVRR
jgi:quercetin dioxygenase-like cupin family protein